MLNIPHSKIQSNTDLVTMHFWIPLDVKSHFNAWKSLNGFPNKHVAMEYLLRQFLMQGVHSTNEVLSNNDISIRPHRPIQLN